MRKLAFVVPVVLLAAGSTGCATKKFVRGEVGQVNGKVEGLSTQVEETQERTRKNEQKIGEVDTKADAAGKSAQEARQAAPRLQTRRLLPRRPRQRQSRPPRAGSSTKWC